MLRLCVTFLCIAVAAYAAACAALYLFQRSFIYFPQAAAVKTPVVRVKLGGDDDAHVLAAVRAAPAAGAGAVVYFGGNGEDVSQNLQPLAEAFPTHAIYLLYYRGFGGSGGRATEEALQQDALALFDQVQALHTNVVVIGRSLGTGVALRVASLRRPARLVLVTPYDSLQELAVQQFRYFPVRWLLIDKFESWKYVAEVQAPTLIVTAEHDEVIPRASTDQLYARFTNGQATQHVVLGATHNSISQHPQYLALLRGTP